jgi:predicted nucleic acid-binding protein
MTPKILLDAGPLVAFLSRSDQYHSWAVEHWGRVRPPLLTCEAVITEACYLLRRQPSGVAAVMELIERRIVLVAFSLEENAAALARLLAKYAKVPMSLADACLVRMAEVHPRSTVLTLDSDFRVYRKGNRQVVPAIMPEVA